MRPRPEARRNQPARAHPVRRPPHQTGRTSREEVRRRESGTGPGDLQQPVQHPGPGAPRADPQARQWRRSCGRRQEPGQCRPAQPTLQHEPSAQTPGLPELPQILGEVFHLKVGEVSKPLPSRSNHLLFRVQEELPEAVPPFKEIRTKVLAAYQLEEARKLAVAKAQQALKPGGLPGRRPRHGSGRRAPQRPPRPRRPPRHPEGPAGHTRGSDDPRALDPGRKALGRPHHLARTRTRPSPSKPAGPSSRTCRLRGPEACSPQNAIPGPGGTPAPGLQQPVGPFRRHLTSTPAPHKCRSRIGFGFICWLST